METSIISGIIGGVVAIFLGTFIAKRVKSAKVHGQLKFNSFMLILGVCCFAIVLLAVWALFNDADAREDTTELFSIIGLFVGFGFATIYVFGEYFGVRGDFDSNSIEFNTPWTGRKTERWEDLESLRLNAMASWYVLTFKSGKKIRLSTYLSGHGDVVELLESKGFKAY